MKRPLFSVIIPTHNRAHVIKNAIQSVIEQTFEDFELVVGNNFSADNTKEVVSEFNDRRVRYFETDELLTMGDSWSFAIEQARGEYLIFLSDDDATSIVTLELVKEVIDAYPDNKLIVWTFCDYFPDAQNRFGFITPPNTVWIPSFSGKIYVRDSKRAINDRFSLTNLLAEPPIEESDFKHFPALINAAYHRSIFSSLKEKKLKFQHSECASTDFYSVVTTLYVVDSYVLLDYPFHLHSFWEQSATTTLNGNRKYYKNSKEKRLVPAEIYTTGAFTANALLHAKNDVGQELNYLKIDWTTFFIKTYEELMTLERLGIDISEDLYNFRAVLGEMPLEAQKKINSTLPTALQNIKSNFIDGIKQRLRPLYSRLGLNDIINDKRMKNGSAFFMKGEKHNFSNILELARKMNRKWLDEFKAGK